MNPSNIARAVFLIVVAYFGVRAARREARLLVSQIRATLPGGEDTQ